MDRYTFIKQLQRVSTPTANLARVPPLLLHWLLMDEGYGLIRLAKSAEIMDAIDIAAKSIVSPAVSTLQLKIALFEEFRAKLRAERVNAWRFDGEAIGAIPALEVHDEQVELATKEEMRAALTEVYNRIESGNVYQERA